jgi:methionyl-tRNA formyltransferase
MNKSWPVVFFGSQEDSLTILKKIITLPYLKVVLVVTQPPRPSGRKKTLTSTPVGKFSQRKNLPLFTPTKLNYKNQQKIIQKKPALGILAAYGQIIPPQIITLFPKGIINIHPSLLPQYRGPAPVVQAILDGQKTTGVTIFLLDEKIDHGPIIAQEKIIIDPKDTQKSLTKKLFLLGAQLLEKVLPDFLAGSIKTQPQNHQQATFTKLLSRKDGYIKINQLKKAFFGNKKLTSQIDRKIRAFYPWPGTYTKKNNQRIKIIQAHQKGEKLKIDLIQFSGRQPIPWNKNLSKRLFE